LKSELSTHNMRPFKVRNILRTTYPMAVPKNKRNSFFRMASMVSFELSVFYDRAGLARGSSIKF
jgi:hypothetical protein